MAKKNNKRKKRLSLAMPSGYSMSMHASLILLNLFGFLMILSANMTSGTSKDDLMRVALKETMFIVVSYVAMVFVARRFSFRKLQKYYWHLLAGLLIALFATLAFPEVNGAKAWIRLGGITVQPAEFMKVFMILIVAQSLGDKKPMQANKENFFRMMLHPLFIIILVAFIVVIAQSDLGTGVVILGIAYMTMLIPNNPVLKGLQKVMIALVFLGLFLVFFLTTPTGVAMVEKMNIPAYMIDRFKISSNPFSNRYDFGYYQIFNGIVALVKGGLLGVGYGQGFIKYSYLPESQNDAILAVIVEELGMIGFLFLMLLYGVLVYQLIKYAFRVKTEKDRMILVGTLSYLVIHFVFNVGGITAFIPLTGVPLLLISAGGSSRMAIMMAFGLSQNVIARHRSLSRKQRRARK